MKLYYFTINKYQTGDSSEYANNIFNYEKACKFCGTGATVAGPHKLKNISKNFDKHLFLTYTRDFILSEQLKAFMEGYGINVLNFLQTQNQKAERLPFYHMTSPKTMPPFEIHKGLIRHPGSCDFCKRDHYSRNFKPGNIAQNTPFWVEDLELAYGKLDKQLLSDCDVFKTWECPVKGLLNADGTIRVLPKPMLIVTDKVKNALDEFGVNYGEYSEVRFL